MTAYGGIASGAAVGSVTTLDTANLNVTGSNLALVCGAWEDTSGTNPTMVFVWDPAGNNESMTGEFDAANVGNYLSAQLEWLDDPTAANAPVRVTYGVSVPSAVVFAAFFTNAANIVGADTSTTTSAGTPTSISTTVPNAASGDLVVDFCVSAGFSPVPTLTVGANQTDRLNTGDGNYTQCAVSTQAGADGGVMSWTIANATYGAILIGANIPDAGVVSSSALRKQLLLGVT